MKTQQRKHLTIAGLFFLLLISAATIADGSASSAEERGGVQLSAAISISGNLAALKGVIVTVHLRSGLSLTGSVKEVKKNILQLERLSGKEFYDALVNVEEIVSIEVKVR